MFDILKFGKELSRLRKQADLTQCEVADKLNLSHQAVSKYERGESFPDISVIILIAELFNVTVDELINSGSPTSGESGILKSVAYGKTEASGYDASDIVNLAPILKPSVLEKLSQKLEGQGIDINYIVALAEYLNDESVEKLIKSASYDGLNQEMLEKLIPILDYNSKVSILQKILDGQLDWHLLKVLWRYDGCNRSQIEAAVVFGVLPDEVLTYMREELF